MTELMQRRRALMAESGGVTYTFIEYIASPSPNFYKAGCILPQKVSDIDYLELDIKLAANKPKNNIFLGSWRTSNNSLQPPNMYVPASNNNGYVATNDYPSLGVRGIITASYNGSSTDQIRVGGWGSNVFSAHNYYYGLTLKKNSETIAHYVPAIRNTDNVVGLYDTVNDLFVEEQTGAGYDGFEIGGAI